MPITAESIRAAVEQRFAQVACAPDQEKKFPVGPASAKLLGYDPKEIDALPATSRFTLLPALSKTSGRIDQPHKERKP